MAKKRPASDESDDSSEAKPTTKKKVVKKRPVGDLPWHPVWRWLVSALVVLHLTAVFCAPWDLATADALPPGFTPPNDRMGRPLGPPPPENPLWQKPVVTRALHRFFHDYLNVLYLNHGYEFFAPDPAGTHVIDYKVTPPEGETITGRFPSHDEQWPRLLYHRHMMLAEQTQMIADSAKLYADHLATLHGGPCRLELKMHQLLPPDRVAAEMPLDDPATFRTIGTVERRPRPTKREPETPEAGQGGGP